MIRRRWYRLKSRSVNCRELGKVLQSYLAWIHRCGEACGVGASTRKAS